VIASLDAALAVYHLHHHILPRVHSVPLYLYLLIIPLPVGLRSVHHVGWRFATATVQQTQPGGCTLALPTVFGVADGGAFCSH
jgi:hypothetical protein